MLDRDATNYPGASIAAPTASLPLLRIFIRLSVGIEIDFIDTCLPWEPWFGVPRVAAQLDSTELLHCQAAPFTSIRHLRQAAAAASSKLITENM